jgi:hypothetical protein
MPQVASENLNPSDDLCWDRHSNTSHDHPVSADPMNIQQRRVTLQTCMSLNADCILNRPGQ